jgi:hypothetical protein
VKSGNRTVEPVPIDRLRELLQRHGRGGN